MMFRTTGVLLAFVLCTAVPLLEGAEYPAAYARKAEGRIVLGNSFIEMELGTDGHSIRMLSLKDKAANASTVEYSDLGFELVFARQVILGVRDFSLRSVDIARTPTGAAQVTVLLDNREHGLGMRLVYTLTRQNFFLRKQIAVRSSRNGPGPLLREARIEHLAVNGAALEPVAMGQPIFVGDQAFFGLEYPAGRNRVDGNGFMLYHLPGKQLGAEFLELKREVVGVAAGLSIREAFAEYVRRIRIPPRSFVLYNSWYDIRRRQMSTKNFIHCFEGFRKHLIVPYRIRLDSFVVDDGYQKYASIWETDKTVMPKGFRPLADALRAHGSRFGLWMPLTPIRHNLDLDWGKRQGYEITDTGRSYCVSGPKFHAAMKKVIARHVRELGLNYYKHDFNSFSCAAPGHGHLPERDFGFEANVDAYIGLLEYEREQNPAMFVNVTSNMWLSPWWLMYADTVWRGGGDTGHERVVPYVELRDDTMTYVDGVLWDRFVHERLRFPPSALMTHGIVYGKLNRLGGGHEPLHRWAEHVIEYLAPGLMMKELYLTPSLLSDSQWDILGKALKWADDEAPLLARSRMTHGNPHKGAVYGFVHADPGRGRLIWFLRNPALIAQRVPVALARDLGVVPVSVSVLYPYCRRLTPADRIELKIPPFQTMVLVANSAVLNEDREKLDVTGGRWALTRTGPDGVACRLIGRPGTETRVFQIKTPAPTASVLLDGAPVPVAAGSQSFALKLRFSGPAPDIATRPLTKSPEGGLDLYETSVPPGTMDAFLALLCRGRSKNLPFSKFQVDGTSVKVRSTAGPDWKLVLIPLPEGLHRAGWEIDTAAAANTPFATPAVQWSVHLLARCKLASRSLQIQYGRPAHVRSVPPTPFADFEPTSLTVRPERELRMVRPGGVRKLTEADLPTIHAAKLHLMVFDVNGEKQYRHKTILLNGKPLGLVPVNHAPISRWEGFVLDVPKELLKSLKISENHLVLNNAGGDCYKVTGMAIAVQLPDGAWVESNHDRRVYCSVDPSWKYFEGIQFKGTRSRDILLSFPKR